MTNVAIAHTSSGPGLNNWGTAVVVNSRIEDTSRLGVDPGDGVRNVGTLIMNRGLIAGNEGHGLSSGSIECTANTYLINVTISGNRNRGIDATCGQLILRHVTIAANTADTGAGGLQVRDAIPVLENSIVAANSGKQCGFLNGFSKNSISVSHSLDGDGSCTAPVFPGPMSGNVVGVDPKLSALAYRVGEDWIVKLFLIGANRAQALLPGSPAIDSGANEFCNNPFVVNGGGGSLTDQLGSKRPVDGDGDGVARCDMGAYEYQPLPK